MGYRTRSEMFKADFAAGQSPFQSTGDISLTTAITDQILPLKGDFLYIDQASTGSVYVELNAKQGGTLAPVLLAAGGSIEIPDGGFNSIKINAVAQLNKYVRIIVGNGARIKGGANVNASSMSVSVVDGGLLRTQDNSAFIGYSAAGALAANYTQVQLWNPAGSGKRLVVEKISSFCSVAASMSVGYHTAAYANVIGNAASKSVAGAASVAEMRYMQGAATYTGAWFSKQTPANTTTPEELREPIIIPPGYGLVVRNTTVNQDLGAYFEFFEQ